jgi:hypothetical protein
MVFVGIFATSASGNEQSLGTPILDDCLAAFVAVRNRITKKTAWPSEPTKTLLQNRGSVQLLRDARQ